MNATTAAAFTWTAPAWLVGLAAVALPILAHLWTRTSGPPLWFPSLRLLNLAQADLYRHRKLADRLLLALRCLLVTAVVLAFAGPAWQQPLPASAQPAAPPTDSPRLMAYLLDASASMTRTTAGLSLFEQGRQQILQSLHGLDPAADRAMVVLATDRPRPLLPQPTANFRALADRLAHANAHMTTADLAAALAAVPLNAQVHLFTDAQACSIPPALDRPVTWHRLDDDLDPANFALLDARLEPARPIAGLPCRLTVTLANFSDSPARKTLLLTGQARSSTTVLLPAGQTATASLTFIPSRTGPLRLDLTIPPDRFDLDNHLSLLAHVRPACPVALLTTQHAADSRSAAYYLARAIQPIRTCPFQLRLADSWTGLLDRPRPDILVLLQPPPPTRDHLQQLAAWQQQGMGMVQFAWPGTGLLLHTDQPPATTAPPPARPVRLDNTSLAPALFDLFIGEARQTLLETTARAVSLPHQVPAAQPLARWDDGRPALLALPAGSARHILCTAVLDPSAGHLVRSPAFVPLVHQVLKFVLPQGTGPLLLTTGQPARLTLPGSWTIDRLRILTPGGKNLSFQLHPSGNLTTLTCTSLDEIGLYTIADQTGRILDGWSVLLDRRESDLRPAGKLPQVAETPSPYPPQLFADTRQEPAVKTTPLWPWCLLAAVLLAIAESLTAWAIRPAAQSADQPAWPGLSDPLHDTQDRLNSNQPHAVTVEDRS